MKVSANFFRTESAAAVRPGHALLVMSMINWMAAFLTTAINIALPSMQTEFHLGPVALGWFPLCYVLAIAVVLVPFGKIADSVGRHLIFVWGLGILLVGTVASIFVGSYAPLVIFRVLQGAGAGLVFAGSTAIVTLAYPPARRGFAMGIMAMTAYLGQASGPIIGGVIVQNIGWRALFLISACYVAVNAGFDLWLLRRAEWKDRAAPGFDWPGSLVYALSLSAFLLGLSWLPLVRGVVLAVVGIAGLAGFGWLQTRARTPVFDVNLFRHNRLFALSNLTALISYASVWAMSFLMSLYLQFVKGLNAQQAGLVMVAGLVLQCALSPFGGRLSDRIQPRLVVSVGMALCVVGLGILSFLNRTTPYWVIILALCALGIGYAFFSGPNQASIMGSVERKDVGLAGASLGTTRVVGQAISIAIATLILAVVVGRQEIQPADYPQLLTAIHITFAIMAFLSAVGIVASLSRGNVARRGQVEEPVPAMPES